MERKGGREADKKGRRRKRYEGKEEREVLYQTRRNTDLIVHMHLFTQILW